MKEHGIKTCWYTGFKKLPDDLKLQYFDFVKVGPYIEALGGLKSRTTNQRFYRVERIEAGYELRFELHDMTEVFWKK